MPPCTVQNVFYCTGWPESALTFEFTVALVGLNIIFILSQNTKENMALAGIEPDTFCVAIQRVSI